jgi:hypothetical protein
MANTKNLLIKKFTEENQLTLKVSGPVCNTAVEKPGNNRTRDILMHPRRGNDYPEKSEVGLRLKTKITNALI